MDGKLVLKGFGRVDGEYPFDLGMLAPGHPEAFTAREQHRIKLLSGLRGSEITDGILSGDAAALVAFTLVILERAGKSCPEDRLWDTHIVSAVAKEQPSLDGLKEAVLIFVMEREEQEVEAGPPAESPPQSEKQTRSGGESLSTISDDSESDLSSTGARHSEMSVTSALLTSPN